LFGLNEDHPLELTQEQRDLRHMVHDFVAKEVKARARHTDESGEFNWTAVKKMGPLGLLDWRSRNSTAGPAWTP
jgi:alkylation response protein AidB-like acyl-CoA dehydrogenase